jgi:hypothetical protein
LRTSFASVSLPRPYAPRSSPDALWRALKAFIFAISSSIRSGPTLSQSASLP